MVGADMSEADFRCHTCAPGPVACPRERSECMNWQYGHFPHTDFRNADPRGTDFGYASLANAYLTGADLRGANLEDTWLWREHSAKWQSALYDDTTKLPSYLDPQAEGMVFDDRAPEPTVADDGQEERDGGLHLVGES